MKVIGVTGGSGSGKSVACRYLASRGGKLIDCDKVYASLVDRPSECTAALANAFGKVILKPDGSLNRKMLSDIVFKSDNREKLDLLNRTVHPSVIEEVKRIIQDSSDSTYFLIDAPQLFEAGADKICDTTVYVTADEDKRLERIRKRDGISMQDAKRRLDSQHSDVFFKSKCDHTVYNNGTEQELETECYKLLDRLGITNNGKAK